MNLGNRQEHSPTALTYAAGATGRQPGKFLFGGVLAGMLLSLLLLMTMISCRKQKVQFIDNQSWKCSEPKITYLTVRHHKLHIWQSLYAWPYGKNIHMRLVSVVNPHWLLLCYFITMMFYSLPLFGIVRKPL